MMLETHLTEVDDIRVVSLVGRMTLGSQLKTTELQVLALVEHGARKIVIDVSGVDYMDSAGLGAIIHIFGVLREKGGSVRVAGANPKVRHVFDLTNTSTIVALDDTADASIHALRAYAAGA